MLGYIHLSNHGYTSSTNAVLGVNYISIKWERNKKGRTSNTTGVGPKGPRSTLEDPTIPVASGGVINKDYKVIELKLLIYI